MKTFAIKLIVPICNAILDHPTELNKASIYRKITVATRSPSEERKPTFTLRAWNGSPLDFFSIITNQNPKSMADAVKTPLIYSGLTGASGEKTNRRLRAMIVIM
jgi:hypothetical protein